MRIALPLILLLVASPAAAQNYYRAGEAEKAAPAAPAETSNSLTITSIQKCYDQIGPEAAADVRKNYLRPYEECQRRLDEKLKKDQWTKNKAPAADAPAAPSNYYQVQKPAPAAPDKKEPAPAEKKPAE